MTKKRSNCLQVQFQRQDLFQSCVQSEIVEMPNFRCRMPNIMETQIHFVIPLPIHLGVLYQWIEHHLFQLKREKGGSSGMV